MLATATARAEEAQPRRTELTAVPFAGGDSDNGWGGGFIASWARLAQNREPYLARIEATSSVMLKRPDNHFEAPYTDNSLLLHLPHVLPNRFKLRFRISYTREAELSYYGVGNASRDLQENREYQHYGRVHPAADLQAEYAMSDATRLLWGVSFTQNWLIIPEHSRLGETLRAGDATTQRLLGDTHDHSVLTFDYGVAWDTRDNMVDPTRGVYATARVDLSPGGSGAFRHRWGRVNGNVRAFVPLIRSHLTFAARAVSDFLIGDAPFYELARVDAKPAIGGVNGVRGVPAERYTGRIKLYGNVELRSEFLQFTLFRKRTRFGIVGFVDGGRVYADYQPTPELDGHGLGLKYGAGGGLRFAAGKSFVLRFDVAWAKEAHPVSAYVASGHAF